MKFMGLNLFEIWGIIKAKRYLTDAPIGKATVATYYERK